MTPEERLKAVALLKIVKEKQVVYETNSNEVLRLMQENDGFLNPSQAYDNASDIYKQMLIENRTYQEYLDAKEDFRKYMSSF